MQPARFLTPPLAARPRPAGLGRVGGPGLRSLGEGGFALLVTIVLVAFLVLILVGLASFTRVETQVASNNQQQSQARQNALLALNIAVGEVQKHLGPDQRTTARADLEFGSTVPNARWTAAYGNALPANYAATPSALAAAHIDPAHVDPDTGSSARLLTWLISGNEHGAFNPSTDVGSRGEVTTSAADLLAGIRFSPASPVAGLTASATTNTQLTITATNGGSRPATLLVGPNTLESSVDGNGRALDYVAAPLVDLTMTESGIPGLDTSSTDQITIGRYAWWVGDEGVKARINLPLVTNDAAKPAAFATASRAAIELMDAANPAVPAPALDAARIDTAYDTASQIGRLIALNQLPLSGSATLRNSLRRRYHDLTPHSVGVLSDTYAGGLRRDLSVLLASGYVPPAGAIDLNTNPLHALDPLPGLHPTEETAGFGVPTWGYLRAAYRDVLPADGVLVPRLPVFNQPGQPDDPGVFPVLTYSAIGFAFAANGTAIELNTYPLVVLWNPYNSPMAAHTYEVGIRLPPPGYNIQLQVREPLPPGSPAGTPTNPWQVRETRDLGHEGYLIGSGIDPAESNKIGRYFRFQVACPRIEAGESIVFTLPATTTYNRNAIIPCSVALAPGLEPYNYATLGGGSVDAAEVAWDYRVAASPRHFKPVPGSRNVWAGVRIGHFNDQANNQDESGNTLNPGGKTEPRSALDTYLGEPRTSPVGTVAQADIWDPRRNTWYQVATGVQLGANLTVPENHVFQGSANNVNVPLSDAVPDVPSLVTFVSTMFARTGTSNTIQGATQNYPWLRAGNPRAPLQFKTRRDNTGTTNYAARIDVTGWPTWFVTNSPGDRASAGLGHDWQGTSPVNAPVFEIRDDTLQPAGLGRLTQTNLSIVGAQPAHPFGNSWADLRFRTLDRLSDSAMARSSGDPELARAQGVYYDSAFLLNRALWDRHFFSARTAPDASDDPRIHFRNTPQYDPANPGQSAAGLLVNGAFNVNSTSEQAWRALLGGINRLAYDPQTQAAGSALRAVFTRHLRPGDGSTIPAPGDNAEELWQGYRDLSPEQIAQLARNLVAEVRTRGPFVSLADFVNRRLIDNPATTEDERLKGALQAAIDATRVTAAPGAYAANNTAGTLIGDSSLLVFTNITNANNAALHNVSAARGSALPIATTSDAAYRRMAFGGPMDLTQADILATLGSAISARSDTFLIRTYGEVVNPLDSNTVVARAWCEAVVQRMPEYLDATDSAEATPTTTANTQFGRRFQVVSLRWLKPEDI